MPRMRVRATIHKHCPLLLGVQHDTIHTVATLADTYKIRQRGLV